MSNEAQVLRYAGKLLLRDWRNSGGANVVEDRGDKCKKHTETMIVLHEMCSLKVIYNWGCDGSQQAQYKKCLRIAVILI